MKNRLFERNSAEELCDQPEGGFRYLTGICLEKFQAIKERVRNHLEKEYGNALDGISLQQIINEADALAACTPFPALFLPTLAEEKARAVIRWQGKQKLLWAHSPGYAFAV
jgi:hypothetical protein